MHRLQRLAGGGLDDDAVLLAMARHVLGGPRDGGRSSYQVVLRVCGACGTGAQRASGERVPVDAAVVAMAACDAQHIAGLPAANANASLDAEPEGMEHDAAAVPSADESSATRESSDHAHVGGHSRRESDAATGTTAPTLPARANAQPSPRAKQSIPPALRRAVLARDRHRCRVPGCTHSTFVDVHHGLPRSEGGRQEASNLLILCSAHHRATHRGELLIHAEQEGAFTFRHADGAAYGVRSPHPWSTRMPRSSPPCATSAFAKARSGPCSPNYAPTPNSAARASNVCSAKRSAGSGRLRGEDASGRPPHPLGRIGPRGLLVVPGLRSSR